MSVAVLALQGAFIEHERKMAALGRDCLEIRSAADLDRDFDRIILPGGESTVQAKLLRELGIFDGLKARIQAGMPVLATCAGLILLAGEIDGTGDLDGLDPAAEKERLAVEGLKTMPVAVKRNAYGRQLASFHVRGSFDEFDDVPMTFIRAPYITWVGKGCQVLSRHEGHVTAVRCGRQLGLAFHPELDDDLRIHRLFLSL